MKNLFSKKGLVLLAPFLILIFFIPNLLLGKIPFPSDTITGLYHPFRDNSYLGYNSTKFPVKNHLIADPVLQTLPWRKLVVDKINGFQFPFWNPYNFSGQPLLANIQSGSFQISTIFFFIAPTAVAWAATIILPLLVGSIFTFLFLKSLKISSFASVIGSFTFMFSGFFVSWMEWGTVTNTAVWLPVMLLSFNKISEKKSLTLYFSLLSFSVFQTLVSGHLQTALYCFIAAGMYILFSSNLKKLKTLIVILFALITGFLISAPQTMPSLELVYNSARATDQAYQEEKRDWFIPKENLVQIIAPDYLGNPTKGNYNGVFHYGEFVSYIGILPLAFALLSLLSKFEKKYFITLFLLSLFFSIENPISKAIYMQKLPFISTMQPSRLIFLIVFSLSSLAAAGFDHFIKSRSKKDIIPFVILVGLGLIAISFPKVYPSQFPQNGGNIAFRNSVIPFILLSGAFTIFIAYRYLKVSAFIISSIILVVITMDLYRFNARFNTFSSAKIVYPETQILNFLINQPRPFRIMTTDRQILHPNINSFYKLESVDGYDPIYLKSYADFVTWWQRGKYDQTASFNRIIIVQNYNSQIADLMNVKYVLSFDEISSDKLVKIMEEGQTKLYENKKVMPRAFFVNEIQKADTKESLANMLLSSSTDIRNVAFSQSFEFAKNDANSTIENTGYGENHMDFKTETVQEKPLVVSTPNYPGWNVYIDGKKSNLISTNYLMMSTIVPKGIHAVNFKFEPESFKLGISLAGIGFILYMLSVLILWKKKYQ